MLTVRCRRDRLEDDLDLRRRVAAVGPRSIRLAQQINLFGVEPFGYLRGVSVAIGSNLADDRVLSGSRSAARDCNESSRRRYPRSHSFADAGTSLISVCGLDGSGGSADDVEDEAGWDSMGTWLLSIS